MWGSQHQVLPGAGSTPGWFYLALPFEILWLAGCWQPTVGLHPSAVNAFCIIHQYYIHKNTRWIVLVGADQIALLRRY